MAADSARLTVRQVKSGTGFNETQKRTLRALGLGRIGKSRELPDNDAVRGMITVVRHLVEVEEAAAGS